MSNMHSLEVLPPAAMSVPASNKTSTKSLIPYMQQWWGPVMKWNKTLGTFGCSIKAEGKPQEQSFWRHWKDKGGRDNCTGHHQFGWLPCGMSQNGWSATSALMSEVLTLKEIRLCTPLNKCLSWECLKTSWMYLKILSKPALEWGLRSASCKTVRVSLITFDFPNAWDLCQSNQSLIWCLPSYMVVNEGHLCRKLKKKKKDLRQQRCAFINECLENHGQYGQGRMLVPISGMTAKNIPYPKFIGE